LAVAVAVVQGLELADLKEIFLHSLLLSLKEAVKVFLMVIVLVQMVAAEVVDLFQLHAQLLVELVRKVTLVELALCPQGFLIGMVPVVVVVLVLPVHQADKHQVVVGTEEMV
jgi:hypothetical protein